MQLLAALRNIEGQGQKWFMSCLRDVAPVDCASASPGTPAYMGAIQDMSDVVAPDVGPAEWTRVWVDIGNPDLKIKIWLDNSRHSSGIQRAWTNCPGQCGCIKYRPAKGNWRDLCCSLYL
jgi:hypothetical protein